MSCEICKRSSCTRSFHSFAAQEAFDEREEMSDDVETLRQELQEARWEMKEIELMAEQQGEQRE